MFSTCLRRKTRVRIPHPLPKKKNLQSAEIAGFSLCANALRRFAVLVILCKIETFCAILQRSLQLFLPRILTRFFKHQALLSFRIMESYTRIFTTAKESMSSSMIFHARSGSFPATVSKKSLSPYSPTVCD